MENVFDEFNDEKIIAPRVLEEIDGRHLVRYKHGQKLVFRRHPFKVANTIELFSDDFTLPLVRGIETFVNVDLKFDFIVPTNGILEIFIEADSIKKEPIMGKGRVEFHTRFKIEKEAFMLTLDFLPNSEGADFVAEGEVSFELDYGKKGISNVDLNVPFFYVEELILKEGDIVMFENFNSIFADHSFKFNKPIAIRNLHFLAGTPEVVLYWTRIQPKPGM